MLQNVREAGTRGLANEFGYLMNRVNLLFFNTFLLLFLSSSPDHFLFFFQAISTFYSTLHIAQKGTHSWPLTATLEKAIENLKVMRAEKYEALAQVERANKETADLRGALDEARRALELERKGRKETQKLIELEREGREEAVKNLKDLQSKLSIKKEELSAAFQQHEATKNQVSELEKEAKDLKDSIHAIEV